MTVDVWSVALEQPPDQVRALGQLLSVDEHARAGRFVFDRDRDRYVVAHGRLRQLLSRYTRIAPEHIAFTYGPAGKPGLTPSVVCFNMAHSAELAVFAFSDSRAVGIDVEYLREIDDAAAIAQRYFCPRERAVVLESAGAARTAAFMTYWTRKEAILKLTGDGLGLPLDRFDVAWPGESSPGCIGITDASGHPWRLSVRDLKVAPGLCDRRGRRRYRSWPHRTDCVQSQSPDSAH